MEQLDYTLSSSQERNELVKKIIKEIPSEKLTPQYLEFLSDYILFIKNQKKQKNIITDNHAITINKRETSFQGLADRLENGEDGIYGMIANDKNIIFTPKISITEEDIQNIPGLSELRSDIALIEKLCAAATGKKKYLLKKQLIEMRQNQYILKSAYRKPMRYMTNIKSFCGLSLDEHIYFDQNLEPQSDCIISLFNPQHVSALLCNYSRLKEEAYGKFWTDVYYLMLDLDNLIEATLAKSYPYYYDLLILKIDGEQNAVIQNVLAKKYKINHSSEYLSSLWRNKIPKLLAEKAKEQYIIWYFTTQKQGKWKKCNKCGQIKLAHNRFFSKNKSSKDGFYSICKECRNRKERIISN